VGKPKAPAAPDYAAAATNQGKANVDSAIASNYLNQVNQVGPDGSLTYSYDKTKGYTDPTTGKFIPQATATTTLSPEQQQLYDQQNQISTALNDQALKGIGYVADSTAHPLEASQFGQLQSGPAVPQGYTNSVAAGPLQNSYDFSKVGAMPSSDNFQSERDQVTQALMSRLQPQIDADRQAQEARLANQGINLGSSAYGTANDQLEKNVNDQRLAAVLAGSQEQQRLFNNAMGIHQQGVAEAEDQGNLWNSAQNQGFQQGLANADLGNQNLATQFNQGLASNQFTNQAIAQAIQEADYFKNAPLNTLNALRTGNQAQMPTFGNVAGGAQIAAAPVYAATNDAANFAQQNYQNKMAGYSSMLSGLGSIGGAAITKYSDRRLKKNVKKLFKLANGLGFYGFEYLGSKVQQLGYMADEVARIFPNAVSYHPSGYAMVHYGKVR